MNIIAYLRQFRIDGYAIFDFAVAFLGIYLLSSFLSKLFLKIGIKIPKQNWLYLTLPIGIVVHILVGNITPLTRDVLSPHDHYILKTIIIFLLVMGFTNIKLLKNK